VRQVSDLGRLPDALALFLAAVGAAALAHGLVLTSRRRAHDIAVLRALGFTPRQVGLSVVTMSGVTAVIGLVVGIPLGLALGRVVWHQVAESTRVAADVALPVPVLLSIWPAVLLAAAALALLPARRSAAVRPAGVLRSE
jgi:ABC-type antimicrobial peptide transport system permease subunit